MQNATVDANGNIQQKQHNEPIIFQLSTVSNRMAEMHYFYYVFVQKIKLLNIQYQTP